MSDDIKKVKKTKNGRQGEGGGTAPYVISSEKLKEIEILASVLSKTQLAHKFGMCDNTFRKIEERQPEVGEAYARGRANAIEGVATSLITQANDGNIHAAKFYLQTQAGWMEKTVTQLSLSDELSNLADRLPD